MATLASRLALFTALALFGSGCTLHVVSGPVSHQRADHEYHYAMTPDRVRVVRPAPRPLPREQRAQARTDREKRGTASTSEGRDRTRRDATPAPMESAQSAQDGRRALADADGSDKRSRRERRRLADVRQRVKDSKRPTSRPTEAGTDEDDRRKVRFPYWVSKNDDRIDLDGSQLRNERR